VKRADFIHDIEGETSPRGFDVKDDEWPSVFWWTQFSHVQKVKLKVERPGVAQPFEVTLEPRADTTWPIRLSGLSFQDARAERKEDSTAGALRAGFEHSRASVIRLYLILRGLTITRTISWKNLAGPLTIGREAYYRAQNLPWLIVFVGLLSINLAIINFLPIPILDGGHMVFLTYELIMRRRPSDNAVHAANIAGLVLILSLMVCVLSLDIWRMM
jgi:regulator of sigma E protease